jgi:hypothetical protein
MTSTKIRRYSVYGFGDILEDPEGQFCLFREADDKYRALQSEHQKLEIELRLTKGNK